MGTRTRFIGHLAAALGVMALLWLASGEAAYRLSFSARSIVRAERAAGTAAELNPLADRYRTRELALRGQRLLGEGDYNGAVTVLAEAYRRDTSDTRVLEVFQRAQAVQALETNRKAHLQHGHEGPGGTLRPEDIER